VGDETLDSGGIPFHMEGWVLHFESEGWTLIEVDDSSAEFVRHSTPTGLWNAPFFLMPVLIPLKWLTHWAYSKTKRGQGPEMLRIVVGPDGDIVERRKWRQTVDEADEQGTESPSL